MWADICGMETELASAICVLDSCEVGSEDDQNKSQQACGIFTTAR